MPAWSGLDEAFPKIQPSQQLPAALSDKACWDGLTSDIPDGSGEHSRHCFLPGCQVLGLGLGKPVQNSLPRLLRGLKLGISSCTYISHRLLQLDAHARNLIMPIQPLVNICQLSPRVHLQQRLLHQQIVGRVQHDKLRDQCGLQHQRGRCKEADKATAG